MKVTYPCSRPMACADRARNGLYSLGRYGQQNRQTGWVRKVMERVME
jgi:hypothetical protein